MQSSFCLNQQCRYWQQAPCEPSHTSLGEMWALLDSCCLNMGHWAPNCQKIEDDDQTQCRDKQDTTTKSLEARQQAGETASLPLSCLTVASWLFTTFCTVKNAIKRDHERRQGQCCWLRICWAGHRISIGPRHSSGCFPREAPAGEDTAEFDGGMNVFHLKMGVGCCRKGVSVSSQESHCQYFSATWHDPLSLFQRKLLSCLHPSMW